MISLHTFENTDDNCKLLYKWRTDITCNQNSFTQINNYTEFKSKFPSYFINAIPIIFYQDNLPVVYCGIYHTDKYLDDYTISIITNPILQKQGYGKICLKMAINYFSKIINNNIIAEIKIHNKASIKIFEYVGFVKLDEYKYNNNIIIRYIYRI